MPLLLFHGEKDPIVPFAQGQNIFLHAHDPKQAVYFQYDVLFAKA